MVQAWVGHFVNTSKHTIVGMMCPTDKQRVKKRTKSTNYLSNTITMVVELLALAPIRNPCMECIKQASLTAIGGHDRQFFDKLLWGLVTSTIFVRC